MLYVINHLWYAEVCYSLNQFIQRDFFLKKRFVLWSVFSVSIVIYFVAVVCILFDLHKSTWNAHEQLSLYSFKESYLIILEHIFKNNSKGWWNGSVGKVFVVKSDNMILVPKAAHMEEEPITACCPCITEWHEDAHMHTHELNKFLKEF